MHTALCTKNIKIPDPIILGGSAHVVEGLSGVSRVHRHGSKCPQQCERKFPFFSTEEKEKDKNKDEETEKSVVDIKTDPVEIVATLFKFWLTQLLRTPNVRVT